MPAAERLSSPLKYRHVARVNYTGEFPIDMLRYDRCSPLSENDSYTISDSLGSPRDPQTVYVVKFGHALNPEWTIGRWRSYGCELQIVELGK